MSAQGTPVAHAAADGVPSPTPMPHVSVPIKPVMSTQPIILCTLLALACTPQEAASQTSRTPFRLTPTNETEVSRPKLSPDGQWVAYVSAVTYGTATLRVRRVDGTGLRDIATISTTSPPYFSHQFTWQHRSNSTTSELLYVVRSFGSCTVVRTDPGYTGGYGIVSVATASDIYLPEQALGNKLLGVWVKTGVSPWEYSVFYADILTTSGPAVTMLTRTEQLWPVDVSPAGTMAMYAVTSSTGTQVLWRAPLTASAWTAPVAGTAPERRGTHGGYLDNDDTIYESSTQTNFLVQSYALALWQFGSGTLISNNAFISAAGAVAHPGHLASPPMNKQWLVVSAAEVSPPPYGFGPSIVALTVPTQGGFVWLNRAPAGTDVFSVSIDRMATKVAYQEITGSTRAIYVLDLDRELSATCTRAAGQGTITVTIPCAANELCVLGGAYGLAALPQTLPGFVGAIELDNSQTVLHLAVGTGAPVVFSGSFPDDPALVGTTLYYQAVRTADGFVSGDVSRVLQVRWF